MVLCRLAHVRDNANYVPGVELQSKYAYPVHMLTNFFTSVFVTAVPSTHTANSPVLPTLSPTLLTTSPLSHFFPSAMPTTLSKVPEQAPITTSSPSQSVTSPISRLTPTTPSSVPTKVFFPTASPTTRTTLSPTLLTPSTGFHIVPTAVPTNGSSAPTHSLYYSTIPSSSPSINASETVKGNTNTGVSTDLG